MEGGNVGDGGAQEAVSEKGMIKVGGCGWMSSKVQTSVAQGTRGMANSHAGGALPTAISLNPHIQSEQELLLVLEVEAKEPL